MRKGKRLYVFVMQLSSVFCSLLLIVLTLKSKEDFYLYVCVCLFFISAGFFV